MRWGKNIVNKKFRFHLRLHLQAHPHHPHLKAHHHRERALIERTLCRQREEEERAEITLIAEVETTSEEVLIRKKKYQQIPKKALIDDKHKVKYIKPKIKSIA